MGRVLAGRFRLCRSLEGSGFHVEVYPRAPSIWLVPYIGCPVWGCPHHESPSILGSITGLLIFWKFTDDRHLKVGAKGT